MSTPKHTRRTKQQTTLLLLHYKFRFLTSTLLTQYLGLKSNSVIRNLERLQNQGLLERNYDLSYKMDRKPAIYFLAKKGIVQLSDDPSVDQAVLRSYYKNNQLSDEFINHTVDVAEVANQIRTAYNNSFEIFTKYELADLDSFPKQSPDLYVRSDSTEYFLVVAHDMPPYLARKRLREYIDHSEETGWHSGTYPKLLFVMKTVAHQSAFIEYAEKVLESAGITEEELSVRATTMQIIINEPENTQIWVSIKSSNPVALL